MAYAEKVKSPKGDYYRGRYKDADGSYVSVRDDNDDVVRFKGKREAKQAAEVKEAGAKAGTLPSGGNVLFSEWAGQWLDDQNTHWSTIVNRRHHLENHLIPFFGEYTLRQIEQDPGLVTRWERYERKRKYKENSISTWRGTLSLCLGDAVPKRISVNPAARGRGRGRRTAATRDARGSRKVIATPVGMFLIAERMSVLSGRDDEFVMVMAGYWHALRIGELIGLEREFVTAAGIDVQWQLHKLDTGDNEDLKAEAPGGLLRCPPKDGSVGLVASPPFMVSMLADFMEANPRQSCECHGHAYVFNGFGERPRPRGGITMRRLAEMAGVSRSDVSSVINGDRSVLAAKRAAVEKAMATAGYKPEPRPGGTSRHWRSADFERMFTAAVSGRLKKRDGFPERPVPLAGEWPGVRVKGRNAAARSTLEWEPVATGMTPHGWRHAAKTLLEEQGVPEIASETRLRHLISGVSGTYRQVTTTMEERLLGVLQEQWERSLDERLAMSPGSTVGIAGRLLRERAEARKLREIPRDSPGDSQSVIQLVPRTTSDLRRKQM